MNPHDFSFFPSSIREGVRQEDLAKWMLNFNKVYLINPEGFPHDSMPEGNQPLGSFCCIRSIPNNLQIEMSNVKL